MRYFSIAAVIAVLAAASSARGQDAPKNNAKNIYDVRWEAVPEECGQLLENDIEGWDFNFRPYGRTSDLWTDPNIVRDAGASEDQARRLTGIRVSCDADGWGFMVFCAEPGKSAAIAATNAPPYPSLELYFCENDSDNANIAEYWQILYMNGLFREIQWPVSGRYWRTILADVRHEIREVKDGYIARVVIPWRIFWDRLPIFTEKKDNFWRFGAMRWSSGGLTWGGVVHEPDRFGYIRWPEFTKEQKTEIMARILNRGWFEYKSFCSQAVYDTSRKGPGGHSKAPYVRTEPYAVSAIEEDGARTYALVSEDPVARPVLEKLRGEVDAFAPGIARFREMAFEEQVSFYREASRRLYNFRYDIADALGKIRRDKIMRK